MEFKKMKNPISGNMINNLEGVKFEYLTAISLDIKTMKERYDKNGYCKPMWICKCDCGKIKTIFAGSLISGHTISCGCKRKKVNKIKKNGKTISFAEYNIEKLGEDFLEKYWDYNKNDISPYKVTPFCKQKIWIKCQDKDYHGSYETTCNSFSAGRRCPYCANRKINPKDSFAQYNIDNVDEDFLEKYWSEENTLNPWEISPLGDKKVFIKCQNVNYHGSYEVKCNDFHKGKRCPYCSSAKIHPKDSLGQYIVENYGEDFLEKIWSDKNKKSPYEISIKSNKKYWWKCPSEKHEDFERTANNSFRSHYQCSHEKVSVGEEEIKIILNKYDIEYEREKKFEGLVSDKNNNLLYDFYIPSKNILIEYQGQFHDGKAKIQTEKQFAKQKEHDRRKREYAKEHNIKLLEIWYYDFDKIEEILKRELL